MLPDPPFFSSAPLVGWAIIGSVAIVVVSIAIRIVGKAIKVSIRLAFLLGLLVLVAVGLCWLGSALSGGRLPFS